MLEHRVEVEWLRAHEDFSYEAFSRDYVWRFENGVTVAASAAPAFHGNFERVDPEAAFVAAIAGCHMLTFLSIAARKRFVVDRYEDRAVGYLDKNAQGRLAVVRCVLRPRIEWGGAYCPMAADIAKLHDQAHRACFIANSVTTAIEVAPPA